MYDLVTAFKMARDHIFGHEILSFYGEQTADFNGTLNRNLVFPGTQRINHASSRSEVAPNHKEHQVGSVDELIGNMDEALRENYEVRATDLKYTGKLIGIRGRKKFILRSQGPIYHAANDRSTPFIETHYFSAK